MGLDLSNDYEKAKSKISAYKTTVENKKKDATELREKANNAYDKTKSDAIKQISELENKAKTFASDKKNEIKSEVKNQLEQLLELAKPTFSSPGSNFLDYIKKTFLEAAQNSKDQVKQLLIDEIITTIGCSEEQSYEDKIGQDIYIKVSQIDIFKKLVFSPDDDAAKYYYEIKSSSNGQIPYSLNRELYNRLQNLGQSYEDEYNSSYYGASGNQLFDI